MVASHTLDREPPAGQRRPRRRLGWPRNDARARLRSSSTGSGTDAASTDRRDGSRPRRSGEWAGTAAPDWSAPRSGCSPATAWRRVRIGSSPGFTAPRHPPLPIEEDVLRPTSNDGERHEDSLQLDAVLERRKDRAAGELVRFGPSLRLTVPCGDHGAPRDGSRQSKWNLIRTLGDSKGRCGRPGMPSRGPVPKHTKAPPGSGAFGRRRWAVTTIVGG
jgi:hypothetical protein